MDTRPSFDSICATAGEDVPSATRPLVAPIYQTSVFDVESLELVDELYEGRAQGYIYSRDANPNVAILEQVMARLEGGEDAVACASGMAAIGMTLLALLKAGDHVVAASELYGGTSTLLQRHLTRYSVTTELVDITDLDAVQRALSRRPALLFVESISNPLLKVTDLEAIGEMAQRSGARLVVDNTLATPLLLRPLGLGADVVIHSATKFLGGHSDVTGGVTVASAGLAASIRQAVRLWGATLDPFAAWLTVRGVRTLSLRMERACANALEVARFLSDQPAVKQVFYPGLPGHPQHSLASRLLNGGFGSMVSFELSGGGEAASAFVKSVKLVRFAPSLGDTRTTLSHPARTSHRSLSPEERQAAGIGDGLVRLSCGIEAASDIIGDMEQALKAL